jgi:hypothetical protein
VQFWSEESTGYNLWFFQSLAEKGVVSPLLTIHQNQLLAGHNS